MTRLLKIYIARFLVLLIGITGIAIYHVDQVENLDRDTAFGVGSVELKADIHSGLVLSISKIQVPDFKALDTVDGFFNNSSGFTLAPFYNFLAKTDWQFRAISYSHIRLLLFPFHVFW